MEKTYFVNLKHPRQHTMSNNKREGGSNESFVSNKMSKNENVAVFSSISVASAEINLFESCYTMEGSELKKLCKDGYDLTTPFKQFCQSSNHNNDFSTYVTSHGLNQPRFTENPHCREGNFAYDRFMNALRTSLSPASTSARLQIVFHGTSKNNIQNILENGLDPKKRRRRQSYGPGEYFGRDPGVSIRYCRGGNSMLVFLVVLPSEDEMKKLFDQYKGSFPEDYIVVNAVENHLPLGKIDFLSVDANALARSNEMKATLSSLFRKVNAQLLQSKMQMLKSSIIQLVIRDNIDIAGEKYESNHHMLSLNDKREIAMYIQKANIDTDFVSFYFPSLPHDPMSTDEHASIVKNADSLVQEAIEAKHQADEIRNQIIHNGAEFCFVEEAVEKFQNETECTDRFVQGAIETQQESDETFPSETAQLQHAKQEVFLDNIDAAGEKYELNQNLFSYPRQRFENLFSYPRQWFQEY